MKKAKKDKKETKIHENKLTKAAGGRAPRQSPASVAALRDRGDSIGRGEAFGGKQLPIGPNFQGESRL